ncbi:MAG: hypothetical protein IPL16_10450 [Ignavibacteria bacterium]|nr:hypothetical protein [Ignavibacteria bacterium]
MEIEFEDKNDSTEILEETITSPKIIFNTSPEYVNPFSKQSRFIGEKG